MTWTRLEPQALRSSGQAEVLKVGRNFPRWSQKVHDPSFTNILCEGLLNSAFERG